MSQAVSCTVWRRNAGYNSPHPIKSTTDIAMFFICAVWILAFVLKTASTTENRCSAYSQWYREWPRPGEMAVGVVDRCDNCPSVMMPFAGDLHLGTLLKSSQPRDWIWNRRQNLFKRAICVLAVIRSQKERPPFTVSSCCDCYEETISPSSWITAACERGERVVYLSG